MSKPINKIFYLSLGEVISSSTGTFDNCLKNDWGLAIAVCGVDSEYLVLENSQNIEKVFHNQSFEDSVDEFILCHPFGESDTPQIKNLLISAFKNLHDVDFCSQNKKYFCTDYQDDVAEFYPSIFASCEVFDESVDAFYSTEYNEINYDLEKYFSLFSLRRKLTHAIHNIYGVRI
jgi:hypothetical protein